MMGLINVTSCELHGGEQHVVRFDNGYGASIIRHRYSYGGDKGFFELAVIQFNNDGSFKFAYNNPIADGLVGYLTIGDVVKYLFKIASLEAISEEAVSE